MWKRAAIALGFVVLVAGSLRWWAVREPTTTVHPGPVRFELVDGYGDPWLRTTLIRVGNGSVGTSTALTGDLTVSEGDWPLIAQPYEPRGCATFKPYENGRQRLFVTGDPVTTPQTVRLRLGSNRLTLLSYQAFLRVASIASSRVVTFHAQYPDGGAAEGISVRCRDELKLTDAEGEAECGPTTAYLYAALGNDEWGTLVEVPRETSNVDVTLLPAMRVRARLSGPGVDETSVANLTLNAAGLRRSEKLVGNELVFPGLPRQRTIICARVEGLPSLSACDVVAPPDGGIGEAQLELGAGGVVTFQPVDATGPVLQPVVYIDRAGHRVTAGPEQRFPLSPGRHVLVVNTAAGPQRYETVFTVQPGETTALGEVRLE